MTTPDSNSHAALDGLRDVVCLGLERVAICTRENGLTLSAWRLSVSISTGNGTIARVEIPGEATVFRGEGIFLGWTQRQLESAYRRWLPAGTGPEPDPGQFG